jgi:hypothetical protein
LDKETKRLRNLECKKRSYREHVEHGLCGLCGKNPLDDNSKSMCTDCLSQMNTRNKLRKQLHPKEYKEQMSKYSKKWHREALTKIASDKNIPLQCSCGCSEIDLLEIDHLDDNGNEERKKLSSQTFHLAIRDGKRKTDDLTILCKVGNYIKFCNSKAKTGQWKAIFSSDRKECD